jgi:hypothetical protein
MAGIRRSRTHRAGSGRDFAQAGLEPLEPKLLLSTYYIATDGLDTGDGSIDAPFASLRKFFSVAAPGDTVYLRGGTYNAAANVWRNTEPNVSGTAAAPITISNMPGETVILDHKSPTYDNFIQLFNGESYLVFQGLTVKNYLVDFNMQGGTPNHITLQNLDLGFCDIYGTNPDGRAIRIRGTDSITIKDVNIHDIGGVGIAGIGHNTNITIDGAVITRINDGRPGDTDADGINFTYGDQSWSDNITVTNCRVWDCTSDGIDIKGDHVLEQNNVVYHVGSVGYKIWSIWDTADGLAQQTHFTLIDDKGWDSGVGTLKAFSLPVLAIEDCTFVGSGSGTEAAVTYKVPYNTEPWKGSLSIQGTIMEHLGGSPALTADKYSDTTFFLQQNTYYSTGNTAALIYTSSSSTEAFTGDDISNGKFTYAMGTELNGSGRQANLAPTVVSASADKAAPSSRTVSFTAAAADPTGAAVTYTWDFGDGTTATGSSVTHTYSAAGCDLACVIISNGTTSTQQSLAVDIPPLLADFNGDGIVDAVDLMVWQRHFGIKSGATRAMGDANGDGRVDGADFLIWQSEF